MKRYLVVQILLTVLFLPLCAQEKADSVLTDNIIIADSVSTEGETADSVMAIREAEEEYGVDTLFLSDKARILSADSIQIPVTPKVKGKFIPDPKKAMWLAIVIPGGGQIYNRKYWKLPIFYGGFLGCFYALNWNGNMYRDYSLAYSHICDNDPTTKSYENFLPVGYDVDAHLDYLKDVFKRKKDFYRRYRDLSLFCIIGVYALSIVDAYIDAEMSSFDISPDLTLRFSPAVISDYRRSLPMAGVNGTSYGINCSLTF